MEVAYQRLIHACSMAIQYVSTGGFKQREKQAEAGRIDAGSRSNEKAAAGIELSNSSSRTC